MGDGLELGFEHIVCDPSEYFLTDEGDPAMAQPKYFKCQSGDMRILLFFCMTALLLVVPGPDAGAVDGSAIYLDLDSMRLGDVYLPDLLPIIRTKKTPWKEFIANGNNSSREVADRLREETSFEFGDGIETRMANGWISSISFQQLGFELQVIEAQKVEPRSIRHAATAALKIYLAKSGRVQPFQGTISWGLSPQSAYQEVIDSLGEPSQWGVSSGQKKQPSYFSHDHVAEGLGRPITSGDDALEAFEAEFNRPRPFISDLFYEQILGNLNLTFHFSSRGQLQSIEIVPQI